VDYKCLRQYANSCADISDGFVADAAHVAKASGVRFTIDADKVPVSKHAGAWLSAQSDEDAAFRALITAGDDYELVFTVPSEYTSKIRQAAKAIGLRVSKVGRVEAGEGVDVLSDGRSIRFEKTGHTHF